jgi:hypothetical protein
MTPRYVSRIWLRHHGRPRTARGTFASGYVLHTRNDLESRWVYWPKPGDSPRNEVAWLSDEGRRVLRDLFVILVAALLVFFLG